MIFQLLIRIKKNKNHYLYRIKTTNPAGVKLYSTGCKVCVTKNGGSRNPQAPTPPCRSLTAPVGTKIREAKKQNTIKVVFQFLAAPLFKGSCHVVTEGLNLSRFLNISPPVCDHLPTSGEEFYLNFNFSCSTFQGELSRSD